jgi:hypothetical protein
VRADIRCIGAANAKESSVALVADRRLELNVNGSGPEGRADVFSCFKIE